MDERACAKKHGRFNMKPAFDRFVTGILRQTDCNREEREDLYEELLSHLECSFSEYRSRGYSEEEAMRTAMTNFGTNQEVGNQLQEAMYPKRKGMMLGLAAASLLFAYSVYASQLFIMGDAHIIWLVAAVVVSVAILYVTVRPVTSLNRRLWMNGLLLLHLVIFSYGLLLATDVDNQLSVGLTIIACLILLLAILLVYRTTIYDYPAKDQMAGSGMKWLHFINITTGIFVVFVSLFFVWVMLWFTDGFSAIFLLAFIPITAWAMSYAVQLRLMKQQKPVWAYAVVIFQMAIILSGLAYWIVVF